MNSIKLIFPLTGLTVLILITFFLLRKNSETTLKKNCETTIYTIYQIEYQKRIRREEIFVKDKFNFTIVYYSGWQKSDSVIYQKKKNGYTLIREFSACYDENYSRFKGYRFEACYKDFRDSLTAKYFIYQQQGFPKMLERKVYNKMIPRFNF